MFSAKYVHYGPRQISPLDLGEPLPNPTISGRWFSKNQQREKFVFKTLDQWFEFISEHAHESEIKKHGQFLKKIHDLEWIGIHLGEKQKNLFLEMVRDYYIEVALKSRAPENTVANLLKFFATIQEITKIDLKRLDPTREQQRQISEWEPN